MAGRTAAAASGHQFCQGLFNPLQISAFGVDVRHFGLGSLFDRGRRRVGVDMQGQQLTDLLEREAQVLGALDELNAPDDIL